MRKMKFVIAALSTGLVAAAAISCDPETTVQEETAYEVVAGNYTGKMTCATTGESGATVGTEDAAFEIKDEKITFASFPSVSIITALAEDEEEADYIIEALGNVGYTIGFTAAFNTDKTEADLTLTPGELTLSWPGDVPGEDAPVEYTVVITFSTATNGKYVVESKKLTFALNIDKVVIDDEEVEEFVPLLLSFDMTKN